jgi:hypothetical protein
MAVNKRREGRNLPIKSGSESPQDQQILDPAMMTGNDQRITQRTIQILVEKHNPEDVKTLLTVELDVYRERLKLIRDHAEHHPDAKEDRATKLFRRTQYTFMLLILIGLLIAIPFVTIESAAVFGIVVFMIVGGVLLNARDRDFDLNAFTNMINTILRRK